MATLRKSTKQGQQQQCLNNNNATTQNTPKWGVESSVITAQKQSVSTINNSLLQKKSNKTGLPDNIKSGVESMSGIGLDDVKVHYNSHKPAQMKANAYTQGNQIHVGPGQNKYLGHEAWHVVQQKQGRVKPTKQENNIPVNDSHTLEHEADVMGNKAMQFKKDNTRQLASLRPPAKAPAQFNRNKNARLAPYIGGTIGLLAGALLGPSIPLVGAYLGKLGGGLLGSLIGYALGDKHKTNTIKKNAKLYSNNYKGNYQIEWEALENHRSLNEEAKNIYEKGTIVKYNSSNEKKFLKLLHQGDVLYTYDVNNQLSIGSGLGVMKHALVAKGKDLKAAGWARPQKTQAQHAKIEYEEAIENMKKLSMKMKIAEPEINEILEKANTDINNTYHALNPKKDEESALTSLEQEKLRDYLDLKYKYEFLETQLSKMKSIKQENITETKKIRIQIDNNSGHYHPTLETEEIALLAWREAGFSNVFWKKYK